MKRPSFLHLIITVLFLAAAVSTHAAFDSSKWTWKADLSGPEATPGFVQIPISPSILDLSRTDLEDLRIADENAELVPHRIFRENTPPPSEVVWRALRLLNASYQPGEYVQATLDFGAPVEKNRIKIDLTGVNFRREVRIEGGSDGVNWDRVAENLYLFSIDQPGHTYRLDTLSFPVNNFRYMRLTVYEMRDDAPFQIERVSAAFERPSPTREIPLPVAGAKIAWNPKDRVNSLELDLRYRNVPVSSIRINVADPYFYRPYVLEGRNATTESLHLRTETAEARTEREAPWQRVREGILYRIQGGARTAESTAITGICAPYRYLRVRFHEGDNPPLQIEPESVEVFWRMPRLVLDWRPGRPCALWGGNPAARAANYDLAYAAQNIRPEGLPEVSVGKIEIVAPGGAPVIPWTERHGWALTALLALAVAATAAVLLRSLKGMKGANGENSGMGND